MFDLSMYYYLRALFIFLQYFQFIPLHDSLEQTAKFCFISCMFSFQLVHFSYCYFFHLAYFVIPKVRQLTIATFPINSHWTYVSMKYSHTIRVFVCLQFPICLEHYNTIGFLYCTYLCYTNYSLQLNLNMYLNNLGFHAFCPMTYLYKLCVLCEQFPILCYYVISFLHLCTYYLCYANYSLLLNLTTYLSTYAFYHTYL